MKRIIGVLTVFVLVTVLGMAVASAWLSAELSLTDKIVCTDSYIQVATITVINPEIEPATVKDQTGDLFKVGQVLPVGSSDYYLTAPGNYAGTVPVSVTVNYPSDQEWRPSEPLNVVFTGDCTPPLTTTTTTPTTPTTQPPELVPPTVRVPVPVPATPAFTG